VAQLDIRQIPILSDNYIYLIHEPESGATGVVDPAGVTPVMDEARRNGWTITHILNTHHHLDHVGGNIELKWLTKCSIVGPDVDAGRIPAIDVRVKDGDRFKFGNATAEIIYVPGHTSGHIAYWFKESDALFCGDTLFSVGCGRVFEGTPVQMWNSLQRLRNLPPQTRVYCAHEYTANNIRFAVTVEPDNADLRRREENVRTAQAAGRSTVPSLLGEEIAVNPFLRADKADLQKAVGMVGAPPVEVFAAIRKRKDTF
jgi:hydroxyacylglutathione hydrolase